MSEILSNIVLEPINSTFVAETNAINLTPEAIQLNIFTSGQAGAGYSSNTEVLFNNQNLIDGIPTVTWNGSNISLGNVSTVKIAGGTNGYVLQTDGTGNLDWTAMTGGGGNGSPGGSNTQIQYNDSGAFGGNAGFTFNEVSGNVNMPANLTVVGTVTANNFVGNFSAANVGNANYANYAGNVVLSNQSNITTLGTLTGLTIGGMTTIQEVKEKIQLNGIGSSGTINFDLLDQSIMYQTANATANFTINFRGNSSTSLDSIMSNSQSLTCTMLSTNGSTGYYANVIQIDGTTVTPKWVYPVGAPTYGTPSGIDMYTFNLIKTGSATFTVIAGRIGYQ